MLSTTQLMLNARKNNIVIPGFNISYLPMTEPVVRAVRDKKAFALISIAQADWVQFGAISLKKAAEEYRRFEDPRYTRLHLDHVPAIGDDGQPVDYETIIAEAIDAGYQSVMVDGSSLNLDENIAATRKIIERAHAAGIPVEAEVGAVMGYRGISGSYEELFASRQGFTDIDHAQRLVNETHTDWLSVAVGNIHGALLDVKRTQKKISAKLDVDQVQKIYDAVKVPLVLHGGTGIAKEYILQAVRCGITKINVATAIRQPYEKFASQSIPQAQEAVYEAACRVLTDDLEIAGTAEQVNPSPKAG